MYRKFIKAANSSLGRKLVYIYFGGMRMSVERSTAGERGANVKLSSLPPGLPRRVPREGI